MKKEIYFETTNLNLAVFLYSNDKQVIGVNPASEGQKKFTFIRSDLLEELVWLYKFSEKDDERLLVPVHKYEQARRELLDKLNN
jgi:hypothetical protein